MGVFGVGATREDIDEFNWGWSVRLPQGHGHTVSSKGRRGRIASTWRWGVGDVDPLDPFIEDATAETPPLASDEEDDDGSGPHVKNPQWEGKAPHTVFDGSTRAKTKSAQWDVEWWRLRLCGDPRGLRTRVPYGRMHEPGSMDGLWHGRMAVRVHFTIIIGIFFYYLSLSMFNLFKKDNDVIIY